MSNLQETVKILTLPDQAGLKNVEWSSDGQLLAVSSSQGVISVFVTKLQSIYAVAPPRIALLSSLAEVSIYHYSPEKNKTQPLLVSLEIEPTFLAIGPYNLACGMNNRIYFYDLGRSVTDSPIILGDREYMAEIKQIQLNTDYCAVLCGSQIMLHSVSIARYPAMLKKLIPYPF
jgi:WD repeat-containing protein 19